MIRRLDWLLVIVSGALVGFAFAPYPTRFLALIALVPLVRAVRNQPPRRTFLLGWLFGAAAGASTLWWLYTLVVPLPGYVSILLYIGVTLLFGFLGLFTGVWALGLRYLGPLVAPFLWAGLEFLRSQTAIAFPWELLGYSVTPYPVLAATGSLWGVYGLSAWVVAVNLLVAALWDRRRRLAVGVGLGLVVGLPALFGLLTLRPAQPWFRVGLVQPNVSPYDKGEAAARDSIWAAMDSLTTRALAGTPALLVYPETATLTDITRPSRYVLHLERLVDSTGVPLLTGTPLWVYGGGRYHYYNGAAVIAPRRGVIDLYRKIRLVPFSEKFPFSDQLRFLKKLDVGGGDATPGSICTVFPLDARRPAALICFEAILPDFVQRFAHRGANLLVNVTNDGWFGVTPGPHQHCEMAVLRAVENGLPLVRCANNGISLVADPWGRIVARTRLFQPAALVATVPRPRTSPTFYARFGDWFVLASAAVVLAGIIAARTRRRVRP